MKIILFDGRIIECEKIEFSMNQQLFVDEEIIIDPKEVIKIIKK